MGPATARALAARGVTPRFVPEDHSAAALAEGLASAEAGSAGAASDITGARILFPRAETAREEAVTGLRGRGALVDDVPVYRTRAADVSPTDLQAIGDGVDIILFMGGSAVHAFCDMAAEAPILARAAR